ncbi:MAG: VOC family protein [Cyanobacteria bacterium J06554_6]
MIQRLITNICSDRLPESRDFYVTLLGFEVTFDSDWYVQVAAPENPRLELGFIQRDHALVPAAFQQQPQGVYLTVVMDDVDAVYAQAQAAGVEIVQPPKDEFYGQRRMLMMDPNGLLVDVSATTQSS